MERNGPPKRENFILEYDAQNIFGAVLRNSSICTYTFVGEDNSHPSAYGLVLDGKSRLEYMRHTNTN